jgi:hypothetical protein
VWVFVTDCALQGFRTSGTAKPAGAGLAVDLPTDRSRREGSTEAARNLRTASNASRDVLGQVLCRQEEKPSRIPEREGREVLTLLDIGSRGATPEFIMFLFSNV